MNSAVFSFNQRQLSQLRRNCQLRLRALLLLGRPTLSQARSQVSTMQATSYSGSVKPPNVLVFQPVKDSTNKEFVRIKEALEKCLSPEHYVVYPLSVDEILQQTPWKENCLLVMIPPTEHAQWKDYADKMDGVMKEMLSFISNGGKLLSMHNGLNALLGLKIKGEGSSTASHLVKVTSEKPLDDAIVQFNALDISSSCFHGNHPLIEDESLVISARTDLATSLPLDVLKDNTSSSNGKEAVVVINDEAGDSGAVCVQEVLLGDGVERTKRAVISNVDLLPSLPPKLDAIKTVDCLKKDFEHRQQFLSLVLQRLGLECSSEPLPQLTHTYLVCSDEIYRALFKSCLSPAISDDVITGKDINIRIISEDFQQGTPIDFPAQPLDSELSIIVHPAKWQLDSLPFDVQEYFESLKTSQLGRTLLYTPVITSTHTPFTGNQSFCSSLNCSPGVIKVAGQQTKGKGRGGNAWISPKGGLWFSMPLYFPHSSKLSSRLSLLQHLVAMATVHGVRTIPGYEDLPIGIKWPNDIYYSCNDDMAKISGIIVSSFTIDTTTSAAIIGCGVNVSNKYPTISLNDCVTLYNNNTNSALPPLSVEVVLARTLNFLEKFLADYEDKEMIELGQLYYKYWLHSGAVVEVARHEGQKFTILGIDKYGYLRVQAVNTGEEISLQPDGNTFDIMKGLIAIKE